eukprot:CAMPEP_0116033018 /NCGR_PEP_ID=MMETSP0321-20121206/18663_1 /TAXON_ID=163516 /ORGANISM="Leptocylindrus danicus var. danicus, Strain B650" /LENGTH=73 /DNA_ID=CAMNT_0003508861 /DNA_START=26 /DNA_END=243 /DNA_ORIENTATION=+
MAPSSKKPKKNALENLIAGGCAGLVESSICYPFDTIKTRMQLNRKTTSSLGPGPLDLAKQIIEKEGFLSLYKG